MMDNIKYLKSESYYSDLYDRCTVEECRRMEKSGVSKDYEELEDEPEKKKVEKIKQKLKVSIVIPTALHFLKGDRYIHKAETIREWMVRDRAKDELLSSAVPPEVGCLKCGSTLVANFRDLQDGWPDKKDRVLFMYDCPNGCLPHRAFYDSGEEWRPRPHLCSKCNSETKEKDSRKGNIITTDYTCRKCGYKEKDVLDLDEKPKPEKIDRNFEKDRQRFCMTEKEGHEYIEGKIQLENLSRLIKEVGEKQKVKEKIADIKKLNIAGLKELLAPLLEKEGYIKLDFAQPEIGTDVIIQFNIQDSQSSRGEYDSTHHLQKLIKLALEKTNWRLMTNGIYYKLGILSGRLRGYENDEDLLKLKIST